jgi:formylglycine-generating enzyme required for sulfatase activity
MKSVILFIIAAISATITSCRTAGSNGDRSVQNVGVVNTQNARTSECDESPFGMTFARIRKGKFFMGSGLSEEKFRDDDEVYHQVTITSNFCIQTTEVTQLQWYEVMKGGNDNPSYFVDPEDCPGEWITVDGGGLCPNNPVEMVSWHDVGDFIIKLNSTQSGYKYRLPTEAEWEYAARGGSTEQYSVEGNINDFAWYRDNSSLQTHPVGQLQPNDKGLHDVHGNVWEWVQDSYGDYPTDHVTDPIGSGDGTRRVLRGGSFISSAALCRSAERISDQPGNTYPGVGFRLARTATGKFEPSYQRIDFSIEELKESLEKLSDTTPKAYSEFYKALSSKVDELPLTGGRVAVNTNYEARSYLLMAIEPLVTGFDSDYFKEKVHASYKEALKELTEELEIESKEDLRSSSKIVGIRLDLSIEALKALKRSVNNEQAQELNEFLSELGHLKASLNADPRSYNKMSEELSGVIESYENLLLEMATIWRNLNFVQLVQSVK